MKRVVLFVLCQFFVSFSFAELSIEQNTQLNDLIEHYNQRFSFDGNVLVKKRGEVLFEKSIGFSQSEWRVSHTSDSKFMVASLSKSFTAAQILIMESKGLLSTEDLVSDYIKLPEDSIVLRQRWETVKIKHLLNHTSGITRNFSNSSNGHRSTYKALHETILHALKERQIFLAEPGERYIYSNFGYLLLAGVIEDAGTRFYEDELKNNILRGLGMFNTGEFHRSKHIEFMADGYFLGERMRVSKRCCDDATSLRGAASLYSTATDITLWLEALHKSNDFFGFDLMGAMLNTLVASDVDGVDYGYGLMRQNFEGSTYRVYHIGHEWGYQSSMSLYPEEDLQIVVLSNKHEFLGNSSVHRVDELSLEISKIILSQ